MMALANEFHFREDNENGDDSDIPRSGVATPQPDPSDKRLPGIMHSYFGQVGSASSTRPNSGHSESLVMRSDVETPAKAVEVLPEVTPDSCHEAASDSLKVEAPLLARENPLTNGLNPYPTPPVSQPPSLHKLKLSDSQGSEDEGARATELTSSSAHHKSISESIPSSARRASLMNPLASVVTASNVHAAHFSNPSDCTTTPSTPSHSRLNSEFHESPSYDRLKKLTDDVPREKSIPATPTRALSNQTVKSDASGGSDPANPQNGKDGKSTSAETAPSQTSDPGTGIPAPAPKGKLTVKIAEARGLRKSRDPYVVAVFQRNELVSKGPLPEKEDDDEQGATSSPMGGIPIMRSGSDSGRPMAIPMKSRQSSNTSLSDYRDFKSKGRRSFTNPKWDTEAVL